MVEQRGKEKVAESDGHHPLAQLSPVVTVEVMVICVAEQGLGELLPLNPCHLNHQWEPESV